MASSAGARSARSPSSDQEARNPGNSRSSRVSGRARTVEPSSRGSPSLNCQQQSLQRTSTPVSASSDSTEDRHRELMFDEDNSESDVVETSIDTVLTAGCRGPERKWPGWKFFEQVDKVVDNK